MGENAVVSVISRSVVVRGEVHATEDLVVEGCVEGPILAEGLALVIAASADVRGHVLARDITVFGAASGQLVATEVVDVRAGARVEGTIVAPRLILDEAARFQGRVEPQHLAAAVSVARYRHGGRIAPAAAISRTGA
jgi:cytoskeletal protein CcmA (bactofilin family)